MKFAAFAFAALGTHPVFIPPHANTHSAAFVAIDARPTAGDVAVQTST